MKYRILELNNGKYEIQRRKYIRWQYASSNNILEEAKELMEAIIHRITKRESIQ